MSAEPTQTDGVPLTKRRRSWFQFSLRSLLILMTIAALIVWQATSEIATARKKDRAIYGLVVGGYQVGYKRSVDRRRRWVTWIIPNSQWDKWFPVDCDRLSSINQVRGSSGQGLLTRRELFQLLNSFSSCRDVHLDFSDSERDAISEADLSIFQGWKNIEAITFSNGVPDQSILKLLATSTKLKEVGIGSGHNLTRVELIEFLSHSHIERITLNGGSFIGDAPLRLGDSLKTVTIFGADFSWDDACELLSSSPVQTLQLMHLDSEQNTGGKWNSKTLEELSLNDSYNLDLDLLGDLPALERLTVSRVVDHDGLGRLGRYPKLKELSYKGPLDPAVMLGIGRIHSLRKLDIESPSFPKCSLESITSLTNLNEFHAYFDLSQEDCEVLSDLPCLEKVDLELDSEAPPRGHRLDTIAPLLDSRSLRFLSFMTDEPSKSSVDDFLRRAGEHGIVAKVSLSWVGYPNESSSEPYLKPKKQPSPP